MNARLPRLLATAIAALLLCLTASVGSAATVAPAAADELAPLEEATAELGRAKRAGAEQVARLGQRSRTVLAPCLRGGPGWKRIRAIEHRSQRALYASAARRLLADMRALLDVQQSRIAVYGPAYERFVGRLRAAPVSDPLLSAAIAAQARRVAAYREIAAIRVSCKLFNRLAKRAREFPTATAEQIVRADYRAAPIARRIERHLSNALRRIDRRNGITYRDAETLAEAAELIVVRGGAPGFGTGFQYALSLR